MLFFGLSAVLILLLVYSAIEPLLLRVRPVEIVSSDLPPTFDGLTIAFLTDIHHGPFFSRERVRHLVLRTNALAPDLILLGGDYVHRSSRYTVPVFKELAGLTAPLGVFGVLGNHDHWEDADLSRQAMAQAGIHALDNSALWLERGDDVRQRGGGGEAKRGDDENRGHERIRLGGVADLLTDDPQWAPALDGTTAGDFVLVVAHNPDLAETLRDDHVDLMLSGHTHGGQVTAFGLWAPLIPSRYGQKYRTGLVSAPHTNVLVSNGIGTITPPLRFFAAPEIVLVTLRAGQ